MKKMMIVMMFLFSCITVEDAEPKPGTTLRECGPRPQRPGQSLAFLTDANGNAIVQMSRDNWLLLDAYLGEVSDWEACASEH